MAGLPRQIPFSLNHQADLSGDSFLLGSSNQAAYDVVMSWPDWTTPLLYLSGPAGSGKSHLAAVWAKQAVAEIWSQTGVESRNPDPGRQELRLVIDDVRPHMENERDLFHLINQARETGGAVLLTSRSELSELQINTPDLLSRLRQAVSVKIDYPEEGLLAQNLVKLFADRQIFPDKALIEYLVARMPRSMAAAQTIVAQLDSLSLEQKKPVNRHLASMVLPGEIGRT